ncbi:hypothetical protein H2200_002197 [Cladophialophora chaetospira]|uniref:RING-type domain-containing protein n=1 Tax=Cladophialophora chaetospira TaxID=386627 RepID=A0AA39CLX1_9EURO|nr:hypothetical protein H2200_002197 [Cladophialophora chaetospira]
MASLPRLQTALEGATIPRDEIRQRLVTLINTELALDANPDLEYPDRGGTLESILDVAVLQDEIEAIVNDFATTLLPTYSEAEYQRVVEIFVSALPTHLSINQQADLANIFAAGLQRHELPAFLIDVFFDNLSEALELRTPSESGEFEFEPVPMDLEDVEVSPPLLFPWFEYSTIIARDPPSTAILPELPDVATLSPAQVELYKWMLDLYNLKTAFMDIQAQLCLMVNDICASDGPLRTEAQQLLDESASDLDIVLLPDDYIPTAPEMECVVVSGLEKAGERLLGAMDKIFDAEKYLVKKETILLANGEKLKVYASRYERSRYRDFVKWHIDGLILRGSRVSCFFPRTPVPEPNIRKYDETEPRCPICCVDLPEEGEICPPAAVSFKCCNKGFHTDCLLDSYFAKVGHGTPCPMCRTEFDLEFLGEMLEEKVRELNVL